MRTNILKDWSLTFFAHSSYLNPNKKLDRFIVDEIRTTLLNYFGIEYFLLPQKSPILEKTNWIHFLLAQQDYSSFSALLEFCEVLRFSFKLEDSIKKKLRDDLKNIAQFERTFFEIYVFYILSKNGLKYQRKTMQGNREREGSFFLDNKLVVFECVKPSTANFNEYDLLHSGFNNLLVQIQNQSRDIQEMVGRITILQAKPNVREALFKTISSIKNIEFLPSVNGKIIQEGDERHEIVLHYFSEKKFSEWSTDRTRSSLVFSIRAVDEIRPLKELNWKADVQLNFSLSEVDIIEKIVNVISAKRKQLKDHGGLRLIIVDNTRYRNFRFSVSISLNERIIKGIQGYLEKKKTDDIVCVIDNDFTGSKPDKKAILICKGALKKTADKLRPYMAV